MIFDREPKVGEWIGTARTCSSREWAVNKGDPRECLVIARARDMRHEFLAAVKERGWKIDNLRERTEWPDDGGPPKFYITARVTALSASSHARADAVSRAP